MKVLLDESLPHELRPLLQPMHDVFTVAYMGWSGIPNGKLLALAGSQGFDALVTTDRGYEHQQNLVNLPCAVVLLLGKSNKIDDIRPLIPELLSALSMLQPQCLVKVG